MSNVSVAITDPKVSVNVNEPDSKVSINETRAVINVEQETTNISVSSGGPQGPRGNQVLVGETDPSIVVGLVGDLYINVSTGFIFGPKDESGWGTGTAIGGETGNVPATAFGHTHYQVTPSSTWTISHSLVFNPNAVAVDLTGKVIEGDCEYNGNTVIMTFSEAVTGAAYLS
jgi:hypothetical protein